MSRNRSKKQTVGIFVVALLLILVLVATSWAVQNTRRRDLDNYTYATTGSQAETTVETTDNTATTATTDEVSVGVDGLLPGDNTGTTKKAETTTTRGTTAGTTTTAGETTRGTTVSAATSSSYMDSDAWSPIFPNLGVTQ